MRARHFAFLFSLPLAAAPVVAYAHGIPFLGITSPIVPSALQNCAGNWNGLIVVINNIIALVITYLIVAVIPLMIAYAGFLLVISPTNPGNRAKVRDVILNAVIGLVIALAAWLIVDAVLSALTTQSLAGWTSSMFGNGSGSLCINGTQAGSAPTSSSSSLSTGSSTTLPQNAGQACNPQFVYSAAANGGYPISQSQASILACIAQPESSCGSNTLNYNWNSGSSAAGAFQVLLQTHSGCYNNPICEQAAGVSGPLNCASGFSNGNPIPGSTVAQKCITAAENTACSAAAAACLVNQNGNFSAWTADPKSTAQQACIINGGSRTVS